MNTHPTDAVLLEHLALKIQGEDLESLLDHLAECDDCVDRLLDLETLLPEKTASQGKDGPAADFELEAAWRELRPRLGSTPGSTDSTGGFSDGLSDGLNDASTAGSARRDQPGPNSKGWWGSRVEVFRAVAAVLLLVSGVLGALTFQLAERGRELERRLQTPQADVPVLYLETVRADGGPEEIPAGDGVALLMITPSDSRPFETYGACLLTVDGREIWSADGLVLSEHGSLRIALPRTLSPGVYTLALEGRLDGRSEVLESHHLALR